MNIKDIFNWVKGYFIEVKHETYIHPTKPVSPWPWPCVTGDYCPRETCEKKPAKKKPIVKDKVIKSMKKPAVIKPAAKKPTVKKATTRPVKKAK